ncbi:hypothetical protein [Bailinhaonella thermotolerans]|uniref:Glycoside-hydrolase family GH114 TIM-barrel domain-containing protein n=1 Tax=Bailinhaonella thermotolerans TaxID=1070861 RepID=A0A3A4AR25_9ACTN|nr:hypothetical protein [Bailinhaonella thermotolerans]RJL30865.1 hypothetical protein D5H75_21420 [Bailinhaonella thermotolerans]
MNRRILLIVAAVAAIAVVATVVVLITRDDEPEKPPVAKPTPTAPPSPGTPAPSSPARGEQPPEFDRVPRPDTTPPAQTEHDEFIDEADRLGMRVWLEAELIDPWLRGKADFDKAVAELARQARRPGVVGIKYTDEVGWADPLKSPEQITRFLSEASAALRRAAPGKLLLVDMFVPELGCVPGSDDDGPQECRAEMRGDYPLIRVENAEKYLLTGYTDAVNLSPDLFVDKYREWGLPPEKAHEAHWREVKRRGWDKKVVLYSRDAELAHKDASTLTPQQAESLVRLRVDLALKGGARMANLWTWRQDYEGAIHRLMDPGNKPNALWERLKARKAAGARMSVQCNPGAMEVGIKQDLKEMSAVFSDVFMWAGVG